VVAEVAGHPDGGRIVIGALNASPWGVTHRRSCARRRGRARFNRRTLMALAEPYEAAADILLLWRPARLARLGPLLERLGRLAPGTAPSVS
jgi:hypothetical protein